MSSQEHTMYNCSCDGCFSNCNYSNSFNTNCNQLKWQVSSGLLHCLIGMIPAHMIGLFCMILNVYMISMRWCHICNHIWWLEPIDIETVQNVGTIVDLIICIYLIFFKWLLKTHFYTSHTFIIFTFVCIYCLNCG